MVTFSSAPGYVKFNIFCKQAEINLINEDSNPIIVDKSILCDKKLETSSSIPNPRPYPMDLEINLFNGRMKINSPIFSKAK